MAVSIDRVDLLAVSREWECNSDVNSIYCIPLYPTNPKPQTLTP